MPWAQQYADLIAISTSTTSSIAASRVAPIAKRDGSMRPLAVFKLHTDPL